MNSFSSSSYGMQGSSMKIAAVGLLVGVALIIYFMINGFNPKSSMVNPNLYGMNMHQLNTYLQSHNGKYPPLKNGPWR
jgi:hypothetical protein